MVHIVRIIRTGKRSSLEFWKVTSRNANQSVSLLKKAKRWASPAHPRSIACFFATSLSSAQPPFTSPSQGSGTLSQCVWHSKRNLRYSASGLNWEAAHHGTEPGNRNCGDPRLLPRSPIVIATTINVFFLFFFAIQRVFSRIRAADDPPSRNWRNV